MADNNCILPVKHNISHRLQSTMGSNIIKSNRKDKITNPNIKDERQKRKQHRKYFLSNHAGKEAETRQH